MSLYRLPANTMLSDKTGKVLDYVKVKSGHKVDDFYRFELEFFEAATHSEFTPSYEEWYDIQSESLEKAEAEMMSKPYLKLLSGKICNLIGCHKV